MTENNFEDELDAIRIKHYELTKNMTPEEEAAYVNGRAAEILKPYGIYPVSLPIARTAYKEKIQ
jgi:hypothetical protein